MGQPNLAGRLAAGTAFGHYAIVRHLGSGAMGSVYEARHTELGKRVAIKTLSAEAIDRPEVRARFLREGQLAAKLQHPHVVDITDFGVENGLPYLVMEFLEGEDLETRLRDDGRLSPQQAADILIPVTAAVAGAHDEKIVHRDLKPGNIFLVGTGSAERTPKVLDFGISKLMTDNVGGEQLTGSLAFLGTPAYVSPEQARDPKHVDDRTDQYALAVVLYECVTGQLPFRNESVYALIEAIRAGRFPRPREVVPDLPAELETVILRGMALRPADRFTNTWELGASLLPFASLRTQVVWEAELKGRSPTFAGQPVLKRTASSSAHPAVAEPERPEPSVRRKPAAPLDAGATSLDQPNPFAHAQARRQSPPDSSEQRPAPRRPSRRAVPAVDPNDLPTTHDHAAFSDDVDGRVDPAPPVLAPQAGPALRANEPSAPGADELAAAGIASSWTPPQIAAVVGGVALLAAAAWYLAH